MVKKNKLPFIIKLIDAYNQYRSVGYPIPTRVYVLNCSLETLALLTQEIKNTNFSTHKHSLDQKVIKMEEGKLLVDDSYFVIKENNSIPLGKIVFGPQQVELSIGD
jgi:hypothetical protein